MNKLLYTLRSGKNPKFIYYGLNYLRLITPKFIFRCRLKRTLKQIDQRKDKEYILNRVNYYNRLKEKHYKSEWNKQLIKLEKQQMCKQKVYFFDTFEYTRWFSQHLKWKLCPGDITFVPEIPSIVKSRPIVAGNENSIIMKLDKIRHFIYVKDKKKFTDKKDIAIFRGKIGAPGTKELKENRYRFVKMYWKHPMCDLGEIKSKSSNKEWEVEKMTIQEHLEYKFILALEGNDVASNLKWVMSSNSLAVMPKPTCETWFMENTLIPNYHYVEIKPDFSDLEEKMRYYIKYPEKAQEIINHANEYVKQFKDKKREKLISLLVLEKYFNITNQFKINR